MTKAVRRPLATTTTTPGPSLLVEQLCSTFPFEVERGPFELFDDDQSALEIGQVDARGDVPLWLIGRIGI